MKHADLMKVSIADLLFMEKREKNVIRHDHIRFIRSLKSGEGIGVKLVQALRLDWAKGKITMASV